MLEHGSFCRSQSLHHLRTCRCSNNSQSLLLHRVDMLLFCSVVLALHQVWDHQGPGYVRYSAMDAGLDDMGSVVENSVIQSALLKCIGRTSNVEIMCPASVKALHLPPYGSPKTPQGDQGRSLRCWQTSSCARY